MTDIEIDNILFIGTLDLVEEYVIRRRELDASLRKAFLELARVKASKTASFSVIAGLSSHPKTVEASNDGSRSFIRVLASKYECERGEVEFQDELTASTTLAIPQDLAACRDGFVEVLRHVDRVSAVIIKLQDALASNNERKICDE
jgi:alpha-D-ribose 1-methylphosphonate 5-triphosphate synthase subunit PhnL